MKTKLLHILTVGLALAAAAIIPSQPTEAHGIAPASALRPAAIETDGTAPRLQ
ncbi:MAG TPA: hypothetical protein VJO99_22665 [Burkholderiaceae bacterium]|nr:hypothetical protein [Burkholderiaceae bacterium]